MQRNRVGAVCRASGIVFAVLAVIGGIVMGNVSPMVVDVGRYSTALEARFNWPLMLQVWVAGVLGGIFMCAMGEIIRLLQDTYDRVVEFIDKAQPVSDSAPVPKRDAPIPASRNPVHAATKPVHAAARSEWRCKKCDRLNSADDITCRACGEYR